MRFLLAILLAAGTLVAEPPRTISHRIRIPVWTTTADALQAEDIEATVGGEPATVVDLKGPQDPLMILLVLDLVGDLNEIDLARNALRNSVVEMPADTYIGLMRAQDGLRVIEDPTDNREAIIEEIETFSISGTPGLLETVEAAADLGDSILTKAPVRLAICYITDSDIRDYREDFTNPVINYSDSRDLSRRFPEGLVRERIAKISQQLAYRQVPIFVVHLERDNDRLNEAYQSGLMQLASTTGGEAVFCNTNSEISLAIENTLRKITRHYALDLQLPASGGENLDVAIESPGEELQYRTRIYLPKQ